MKSSTTQNQNNHTLSSMTFKILRPIIVGSLIQILTPDISNAQIMNYSSARSPQNRYSQGVTETSEKKTFDMEWNGQSDTQFMNITSAEEPTEGNGDLKNSLNSFQGQINDNAMARQQVQIELMGNGDEKRKTISNAINNDEGFSATMIIELEDSSFEGGGKMKEEMTMEKVEFFNDTTVIESFSTGGEFLSTF